jgi:putative cell wall-binding protein
VRRLLIVLALVTTLLPALPATAAVSVQRAAGADRVATAVALSQGAFGAGSVQTAVLASAVDFPDALAATPLAAAVGGPLLLTPPSELAAVVVGELDRLGVTTVHLMGGTRAVSADVEAALLDAGLTVVRHAGADRFETAAKAASAATDRWRADRHTTAGDHVLIALGAHPTASRAWPDALAAGVLAGVARRPILLVSPDRVPAATAAWIAEHDPSVITVVGGPGAIPDAVMDDLGDADTDRRRRGGDDRYDTAALLADDAMAAGASAANVTVATGLAFPDALAAGAATVARNGILLLAHGSDLSLSPPAEEWLAGRATTAVTVAGGPRAVAPGVLGQIQRAIDGYTAPALKLTEVGRGVGTILGATTPPGDARLHVWSRQGKVHALGAAGTDLVLDIEGQVALSGEGGLLGVAFAPDHGTTGRFFVHYTAAAAGGGIETRLSEFVRGSSATATAASERRLFIVKQPATNHNGGTVMFAPDGTLLLFLGDGGGSNDQFDNGQDPNTVLGTVLRFDVSRPGQISPAGSAIGDPAVWMYGLRNPFRADIDPVTGLLHIADVGQSDWEEVDVVPWDASGANFGWSTMEGTHCFQASACDPTGLTLPVVEYGHDDGCSITGGHVYRGSIGMLRGHFFYGDFCSGLLRSFRYVDGEVVEETDWTASLGGGQIWSFGRDAAGDVYVSKGDQLFRIDLA